MNKDAMDYLNGNYLINASIIEPIKEGTVDVLYADARCVFVKDRLSDVFMLQTDDLGLADKLLDVVGGDCALVAHNTALAKFAMRKLGFAASTPCYQGVYRKSPFDVPNSKLELRLMREDEAHEACEMYGFGEESALRHIRRGLVYGAYVGGVTVGMIGMHLQGSMGMLEVKPRFRRNGYAEVMEKLLINKLLERGAVPYCQIIEGNEPSLSLQRKLGLDLSAEWARTPEPRSISLPRRAFLWK